MPLIDIYRSNITRKKGELAKLSSEKSNETKKIPSLRNKIITAKKAMQSTKTLSTIKSKNIEIERTEKELAAIDKKASEIDRKIVKKQKEIFDEEKKYHAEEIKEMKRRDAIDTERIVDANRQMIHVNNTLDIHEKIQFELRQNIVDLQNIPEKITVLFMASNPIGTGQLRLDEEARSIEEMIRKSEYRSSIEFATRWAVRPLDILQAINELNPSIVHFSGHGSDSDELVLQNSDGNVKLISKETIVQTMMTSSDKLRLVFFNTCFSYEQANAMTEHIEAAIGMNKSIGDTAARIFASQFYSAIGFGLSVETAFNQAKVALMLESIPEEDTPQLYVKNGMDANTLIIVRPKKEGE